MGNLFYLHSEITLFDFEKVSLVSGLTALEVKTPGEVDNYSRLIG